MIVKILLVEDNKDHRDSVRELLKSSGYLVIEAMDNEHALSMLASERFDLILVDMRLADKSNSEILRYLKENNISSKVIVITGAVGLEKEIKDIVCEMKDKNLKPNNPVYLTKSIEHALSAEFHTSLRLQIFTAGDFIKSTPTGDLDLIASTQVLAQIATAGDLLQDYTVIIDLRDVQSHLSTLDIYNVASELVKYGEAFQRKIAVLTQSAKGHNQASFFETAAQNRGYNVKAFTLFEDAIYWLTSVTRLPEASF
ncbi:MAG: response regulator [Bacteroidota bacterium]|nr:response regulator [Bacteroidota bacterium]